MPALYNAHRLNSEKSVEKHTNSVQKYRKVKSFTSMSHNVFVKQKKHGTFPEEKNTYNIVTLRTGIILRKLDFYES